MPAQQKSLEKVQTFPQLVAWLRDELDWPLESDNYEDISWEYDPAELGLKKDEAAKIDYIRQLQPMTDKQPFGIFFVKFNKGKLPVVALRRILSNLVVKRRVSANSADRPAWEKNDLLFLSSWGEAELRQMNFAHFADNDSRKDLPTLKVLDWGQHKTALHVRDVEKQLQQNLFWPEDTTDPNTWRKTWRDAFRLHHRETIDTSKALSIRLADLARAIRDRISEALAIETDRGPLTTLLKAFRQGLVHDLDEDGFADMYAQTIAYGLLSARIADPKKKTADDFAAHMRTSPFLRELMETFLSVGGRKGKAGGPGIDFDELGVSEVVELLDEANMEAVVRDFGDKNQQEDPVIHFYELFLHEYNKQLKIQRGVFYTPQPVVSYIVRSVHELLQTEFGLVDGLADTTTWGEMLEKHKNFQLPPLTDEPGEKRTISPDEPFVQILDPATGTATFLVEVIDVIHNTMTAKWNQQGIKAKAIEALWNDYVPRHLLPRMHAYELMMAPYAIAHMKVGLKLAETGYRFETEERARIYLTNALEPWQKQLKLPAFDALAHEAASVNEIKRDKRFTVIIGNPPYAYASANTGKFISNLIEDYYFIDGHRLDERNPRGLQDDYVKFIRFSQAMIQKSTFGVMGYITNHSYIDNPTFPGMRKSFSKTFPNIALLDLHGNTKKGERCPDGGLDNNVFDIQQGVVITIASTSGTPKAMPYVSHADLWGTRDLKYKFLASHSVSDSNLSKLECRAPNYVFVPRNYELSPEYEDGWNIREIMPCNSVGIVTSRDHLAIHFSKHAVKDVISRIVNLPQETAREEFHIGPDSQDWTLAAARDDLRTSQLHDKCFIQLSYRPFDERWTIYTGVSAGFHGRPRREVMQHMLHTNVGLLTSRMTKGEEFAHTFVTKCVSEKIFLSPKTSNNSFHFPLYLYSSADLLGYDGEMAPNYSPKFLRALGLKLGFPDDKGNGLPNGLTPENIFHYIYAVFHSPGYRDRYAEFLKIDFPRLPLTGSLELFRALAKLGGELTALHLLESPKLNTPITIFMGENPVVTKVGWTPDDGGTVWLDGKGTVKNSQPGTSGFRPVPEEVWNFHIGGYQVCEKWLKDRGPKKGKPGRTLSEEDIAHYHKTVIALTETIRIMAEIDEIIGQHGGWPDAFTAQTEDLPKVAEDEAGYDA